MSHADDGLAPVGAADLEGGEKDLAKTLFVGHAVGLHSATEENGAAVDDLPPCVGAEEIEHGVFLHAPHAHAETPLRLALQRLQHVAQQRHTQTAGQLAVLRLLRPLRPEEQTRGVGGQRVVEEVREMRSLQQSWVLRSRHVADALRQRRVVAHRNHRVEGTQRGGDGDGAFLQVDRQQRGDTRQHHCGLLLARLRVLVDAAAHLLQTVQQQRLADGLQRLGAAQSQTGKTGHGRVGQRGRNRRGDRSLRDGDGWSHGDGCGRSCGNGGGGSHC